MEIAGLLISCVVLVIMPTIIGTLFVYEGNKRVVVPLAWVSGQILLWALFFVICVPMILLETSFSFVVIVYNICIGILLVSAIIVQGIKYRQYGSKAGFVSSTDKKSKQKCLLWMMFVCLLVLQLVLTVCMAYEEGDDAYYVAVTTITEKSDTMYKILPYTGKTTGLDARHGLAPFPVWVAWVARMSGIPAVSVSQVVLPLALIVMTYAIYYLIGMRLFAERAENVPLFLILIEVLVLFGGYSVFSAENFLLVRTSQGKAVIANIIIPFLLYMCVCLLEEIQRSKNMGRAGWMLMALTMISGCLCSTLGTLLTCMFLAVVGLCTAAGYRKWKVLVPMGMCCVAPVGVAILYFMLG